MYTHTHIHVHTHTHTHVQAELFAQAAARFKNQAAALSGMNNAQKMASEEEANDANHRNRAISSSAITRAVADANAGVCYGMVQPGDKSVS